MTAQIHPQVAEALRQAQQFQSTLDDHLHRADTDTVTATDETESVEVTLDGHGWLAGLVIEPGLLRLGAEAVEERINDAMRNAKAAAAASSDADEERLVASLAEITGSLNNIFGLS
ncbi:DNA-binding protein [Mycobacterium numidiamassiliense]|uniref:DNA-binding protein n=1 Tax=Mycobacterium numidiamassiliense TaxID=1841861 RepID=A0A2U3PIA0_9MYCO|nr:YbaB/EbfC family nucleoid-associated protein [Mycobacterium numidiamassiliense]SPM43463.1 DNA-binding protein [Mycobacterium numidiamassiliense]